MSMMVIAWLSSFQFASGTGPTPVSLSLAFFWGHHPVLCVKKKRCKEALLRRYYRHRLFL